MKRFVFMITIAIFTILLVACTNQETDNNQTKEAYRQEMWARWSQLNKQIEELRVEAEKIGTANDELIQAIDEFITQSKVTDEQLKGLDTAIGDTWQEYKPEIDQTMNDLEQTYKEIYQQVAAARIKQVEVQIEALIAETEQADAAANPELEATINELEAQRDIAIERLEQISAASFAAWKDLRVGLEAALDEMEDAYQQARSRFEETG